jgi:hypothetical protein
LASPHDKTVANQDGAVFATADAVSFIGRLGIKKPPEGGIIEGTK